jgi:hypothetical protein
LDYFLTEGSYALNFGALGTFSPLRILSATTFLPLEGQPYFGPNTLFTKLQELPVLHRMNKDKKRQRSRSVFMVQ